MATEYFTSMTLNYAQVERDLNECDIIEVNMLGFSHYAFYIGNGLFVHVTRATGQGSCSSGGANAIKCVQTLRQIVGRYPCRINNLEAAMTLQDVGSGRVMVPAGNGVGTPTRPVADAKRRALEGIGRDSNGKPLRGIENGVTVRYHFVGLNCEHYCTHWRYDCEGFSQQGYNGAVGSTLGNVHRVLDASAAVYAHGVNNAPLVLRPVCAVAAVTLKSGAIVAGTGKAIFDGATSVGLGLAGGLKKLFQ